MIDWELTKEKFNRSDLSGLRPQVVVRCDLCGTTGTKAIRKKADAIDGQLRWHCNKCVANDPIKKSKSKEGAQKAWADESYRKMISDNSKKIWDDPDRRQAMGQVNTDPIKKRQMIEKNRRKWEDPEFRAKMAAIYKTMESIHTANRAAHPKVSSIQKVLYSILDDLKIPYYREYDDHTDQQCQIGPYIFDCVIPREGKPTILVECNGDYWHSLDNRMRIDASKISYVNKLFPGQYEVKTIWEHEFQNYNKVVELVKYWIGMTTLEVVDFAFNAIEVRDCPAQDYRLLLGKYHYLSNAGRHGIAYGAYLNDKLIAVCIFSPLVRQNVRTGEYSPKESRELSRLCIHPRYQKKNFASWFVSRCINFLPGEIKLIISYCDTTFNHNGTVYKAANFKEDGEVPPDYWYVAKDGWVMHKRNAYRKAVQFGITEREYIERHGYSKVWGDKKLRFIYTR